MKIVLSLFLTLSCILVSGQENRYQISEVIEVENSTSNELYLRGRQWFISSFNDSNSVIQLDDPEKGIIIGKGHFSYEPTIFSGSDLTRGKVNFIISLEFKDGRYRYTIKDFTHFGKIGTDTDFGTITQDIEFPYGKSLEGGQKWKSKIWKDIKIQVSDNSNKIINSLKESMIVSSITSDDDW